MNMTAIAQTALPAGFTVGSLFSFLLVVVIAIAVGKAAAIWVRHILTPSLGRNELKILEKVIFYSIVIIGALAGLPDMDLSGLLVAGGIASIAVAFASQSVISNLISGLFLLIEQPIRIGDNINVEETSGIVEDIRILSTVVKDYDGIRVRIPNQTVFTSTITNYVANVARRFEYTIGIRYADDAALAVRIAKDVIWKHPLALKNPGPSVYVEELGDNGVILKVRIWAPSDAWWDLKTELLWKIKTALEAEGIEIPFPQRTLWLPEGVDVRRD